MYTKSVIVSLLLSGASAFAPSTLSTKSSALDLAIGEVAPGEFT